MDLELVKFLVDGGGWAVALYLLGRVAPLLRELVKRLEAIEAHDRSQRASLVQLVCLVAVQAGMDPKELEERINTAENGTAPAA